MILKVFGPYNTCASLVHLNCDSSTTLVVPPYYDCKGSCACLTRVSRHCHSYKASLRFFFLAVL